MNRNFESINKQESLIKLSDGANLNLADPSLIRKEFNKKIFLLKNELIEKDFLNKRLLIERDSILSSYSWRLTRPFREIKRWVKSPGAQFLKYSDLILIKFYFWIKDARVPFAKKDLILSSIENLRLAVNGQKNSSSSELETAHWKKLVKKSPILQLIKSRNFISLSDEGKISLLLTRIGECATFSKESQAKPLVSVIIPIYGQLLYTLTLVASIAESITETAFEILIVDDDSPDGSFDVLSAIPFLRVIKNSENIGFLRSCNKGAELAKGEYVYFLNNDTIVIDGWLDSLVDVFNHHADAGLVGSKLIYPDGRLQEAGGLVWKDASAWNYGRLQDPGLAKFNFLKKTDYCSGASIIVSKDVFFKIGCFDERYAPAYCEDTDLAFSIRAIGLEVYYQPKSEVVHFEGISNGTDLTKGVKAYQVRNQQLFKEKWKNELSNFHFNNGEFVFWANNRSRNDKTILIIDHHVPKFDRDAGSRTIFQVVKLLVKKGFQVKFWPDNNYAEIGYAQALEKMGVEVYYGSEYKNKFGEWIKEDGQFIDCFFISRPDVAAKYLDLIRGNTAAPVIYYGHDIHHLRLQGELELVKDNDLYNLHDQIKKIKLIEENIWSCADLILYPSSKEVAYVVERLNEHGLYQDNVKLIPVFGYELQHVNQNSSLINRKDILFVGGFSHRPNVDGVLWFVKEVFPLIQSQLGAVRLIIVGSNPHEEVIGLSSKSIEVAGYVSDEELTELYKQARVAVAPLRFGGGMKGKVIEAFYHGLPVVTTSIGAQGLENLHSDFAIADDPNEFAKLVISLYSDDHLWSELSVVEMDTVKRYFSCEAMFQSFSKYLDINYLNNAHTHR